ncbi:hypothetical protein O1611_g2718 [Lasiodiplodia mahajangana]|uniref:Uncharacterized protein n=1 Tax=Lasiodiplodia mahajangana TaxID=1108764 RepID=A0ACC2JTX2_9PEZI|nr:hypothetical protein O1611_g2718 [Lasiodiplodia mahajangana]
MSRDEIAAAAAQVSAVREEVKSLRQTLHAISEQHQDQNTHDQLDVIRRDMQAIQDSVQAVYDEATPAWDAIIQVQSEIEAFKNGIGAQIADLKAAMSKSKEPKLGDDGYLIARCPVPSNVALEPKAYEARLIRAAWFYFDYFGSPNDGVGADGDAGEATLKEFPDFPHKHVHEAIRHVHMRAFGSELDAKRQRDSDNIDLSYLYDAPCTPSLTGSNIDGVELVSGYKHTADAFTNVEQPVLPPLSAKERRAPSSKRRSGSTSPIQGRLDLYKLEKPMQFDELKEDDKSDILPADIKTLHTRLRLISSPTFDIPIKRCLCGSGRSIAPDTPYTPPSQGLCETPSIRVEPAMYASIARDSILRLGNQFAGSDVRSVLAWSASEESTAGQSTSKKVDYVVVADLTNHAPLKKIILDLILSGQDGTPSHVNQTAYPAVCESLVAVSVKITTILPSQDALLRLAIWVAAWYRRMHQLGTVRARQVMSTGSQSPMLVSAPLIVVTGHEWDIYFTCDKGSSITIRGPLRISSTATDLQLHTFLISLRAVKVRG